MLTPERAALVDRILAQQRELSIPVETKTLRIIRMSLTSMLIFTALMFYKPIALHAPPILNLVVEIILGVGMAYLVAQVWPYMRWVPPSLQIPAGVILLGAASVLSIGIGLMMAPAKPGRPRMSLSETFKRMKRGDLARVKTMGLATSGANWKIILNDGEATYRKVTLAEAVAACERESMHVPLSRDEILALDPRPQVPTSLSFWTANGVAFQYAGGESETLGVSHSGGPDSTNELLCLK